MQNAKWTQDVQKGTQLMQKSMLFYARCTQLTQNGKVTTCTNDFLHKLYTTYANLYNGLES